EIINEFDQSPSMTINSLCNLVNERVYYKSYISSNTSELDSYNREQSKYHAVNLLHEQTIEIRGIHPQKTAQHVLNLMRLFEGRIKILKQFDILIPYKLRNLENYVSWTVDKNIETYKVDINPKIIEQCLDNYIEDAGLRAYYSAKDFRTDDLTRRLI
ncbi:unnamed protein product, partial [Didymodactylos carnosus]